MGDERKGMKVRLVFGRQLWTEWEKKMELCAVRYSTLIHLLLPFCKLCAATKHTSWPPLQAFPAHTHTHTHTHTNTQTHTHARTYTHMQVGSAIGAFLKKFNDSVLPFVEGLMPQVGFLVCVCVCVCAPFVEGLMPQVGFLVCVCVCVCVSVCVCVCVCVCV